MTTESNFLNSDFGVSFDDLYHRPGLLKLHEKFEEYLAHKDEEAFKQYCALKQDYQSFSKLEESNILIDLAPILEEFIAKLFLIENQNHDLQKQHHIKSVIYKVRRNFVQRNIVKKFNGQNSLKDIINYAKDNEIEVPLYLDIDIEAPQAMDLIMQDLVLDFENIADLELKLAQKIDAADPEELDLLTLYCAIAAFSDYGKLLHKDGALFVIPQKTDPQNLVSKNPFNTKKRDGFNLTDNGYSQNRVLGEANYCIFCHKQGKDSCRTGLKEKDQDKFKYDALNVELHGCPLDEKISEMNLLKSGGLSIAALSVAIIDNPMIAGTGHRICNDCMKSCIFQKQDPVDIPQIETQTFKDVLSLPYGFEIYSLFTRWNPLNIQNPLPKEATNKKVLIAGLGPAGYSLAHYLLNEGHDIVAIDGLKIEPLDPQISGIDISGNRHQFRPIKDISEIYEPLSKRAIQGFGGVAEYGITVRWDKNYLKVIRLLLERRQNFRMFGGIRFGSSITDKIAFEQYGFDHVALCIGAGRPNIIEFKNNFAKGVRMASDFLMALQLTGAFKKELFTNLQVRMPIAVIGAGLTAIDTACEAGAYYLVQIEKFAHKYQKLVENLGQEVVLASFNEEEKQIAQEFLNHAHEAQSSNNKNDLLAKWGGVKVIYRKNIQSSPAYRYNHQEINKGFDENIEFIENQSPVEAVLDDFGHIQALKTKNNEGQESIFDCKSLMVAAGTYPNLSPIFEDGLDLERQGRYFAQIDENAQQLSNGNSPQPDSFSILTKIDQETQKSVSFFGDLHPNFEGNVVKAMASAKLGYSKVNDLLQKVENSENAGFLDKINEEFVVKIEKINPFSQYSTEIFIKAPLLANQTRLGQIFRLQNYHNLAPIIQGQTMAMEGVTVTALEVDKKHGIIRGIVMDFGGSTSLIKNFKDGDPAIFMGPSGKATELAKDETVILVGGGRGNMPLTAIAKAYKENGCKIIFFAGYSKNEYVVRQEEIEKYSDVAVFAIENEMPNLTLNRPQDLQFKGLVTQAITDYALREQTIDFREIDRIFVIGNERMSYEVTRIRNEELQDVLNPKHIAITSLNAPMQCMLKGVCSQCLQKRFNEEKGAWEYFYACSDQDQKSDALDFDHLKSRCGQNSLSEKMSRMWIRYLRSLS